MKIISPFKDYYDYCCRFNLDNEPVWYRTENLAEKVNGKVEVVKCYNYRFKHSTNTTYVVPKDIAQKINLLSTELNKDIESLLYDNNIEVIIVGSKLLMKYNIRIGDRIFTFFWNGKYSIYRSEENKIYNEEKGYYESIFTYELLEEDIEYFSKKFLKNFFSKHGFKLKGKYNLSELLYVEEMNFLFDKHIGHKLYGLYEKIRKVFPDVPLINFYKYDFSVSLVLNPQLKFSNWRNLLKPEFLYQEIDLFLTEKQFNNRIIHDFDVKDKIISKGFDLKTSFRK